MKKETKKKKKVEKKKISKKKTVKTVMKDGDLYIAKEDVNAGEPVATKDVTETASVNDQPTQMVFIQEKLPTLRGNIYRQEEINNKIEFVMAFKPQIAKDANGLYRVVIGSTLDKGLCTEGETVLKAMIKMFDQLT